jgi:phosphoesterase RecJ-like protein
MLNFKDVKAYLSTPKKIIIIPHKTPDADALGSSLGLRGYLIKKGHQVHVISPTDYPKFLNWMEGNETVMIFGSDNQKACETMIKESDIIFCLDFNNLGRIDELGDIVKKCQAQKFLIDHHLEPQCFADFAFVSTEASATAELIYEFIVKLGDRDHIDKSIAECLYAGIMTDTGQFKHNNTNQNVHFVTANLMELGADTARVASLIYDTNSYDRLKFLGFALSQRLNYLPEYHTAFIAINAEDLEKFNSQTGDTEGLVNYSLSLDGVVLGVLISERGGEIKLSMRSKGDFSVNEFARKHFNGGGHKNAAGGTSDLNFEETVRKFEDIVKMYRDELNEIANKYAS